MFDQIDRLDILIVYAHKVASSASSKTIDIDSPFATSLHRNNYNKAYAYFLETCQKQNIKAGLSTTSDIIGPGLCQSYWILTNNSWIKMKSQCFSNIIFDKFSPSNKYLKEKRELFFSDSNIIPFNDPYLFRLFFDKLKSFRNLTKSSIPTVSVDNKIKNINSSLAQLKSLIKNHKQKNDFGPEIILKDRYGSGGYNIYKISSDITRKIKTILTKNQDTSFILQPFALFEKGYSYQNLKGAFDIRLIFMGTKIIQTYIRMAKKNDFRCNEHQGGSLTYIEETDLPKKLINFAQAIAINLNKQNSLYALDFIVSNNDNVYFLEGNCGPGVDWNLSLKKNELMSKKLIRTIVRELKSRVNNITPNFNLPPSTKVSATLYS